MSGVDGEDKGPGPDITVCAYVKLISRARIEEWFIKPIELKRRRKI